MILGLLIGYILGIVSFMIFVVLVLEQQENKERGANEDKRREDSRGNRE